MRAFLLIIMVVLAGCASPEPTAAPDTGDGDPAPTEGILSAAGFTNFTGVMRSLPALPGTATGEFVVLSNTGRITVTLLWSDPLAEFSFSFEAQNASAGMHGGGRYDAPGAGRVVADIPGPATGTWIYTIEANNAVDVTWDLIVFVAPDDAITTVLSESFVMAAGSFFEINTEIKDGASMSWDWSISDATSTAFNVHTHFDDEVQYLIEASVSAHAGRIDVNRTGGYSLMWENPGATPQTIEYKVWGDLVVDSYFPPR